MGEHIVPAWAVEVAKKESQVNMEFGEKVLEFELPDALCCEHFQKASIKLFHIKPMVHAVDDQESIVLRRPALKCAATTKCKSKSSNLSTALLDLLGAAGAETSVSAARAAAEQLIEPPGDNLKSGKRGKPDLSSRPRHLLK